ncbi:hypothetical protein [Mycobacterium sp. MMS18-G62]
MRSKQLKLIAAGIGASAVVAMGAVTVVLTQAPAGNGTFGKGPEITLGDTVTTTTPPSKPETSVATPPVTATTPSGFATP